MARDWDDEAKLRVLLMHPLHPLPNRLHVPYSEDIHLNGRWEVRATLINPERQRAMSEEIVQRLSLESGTSWVSWELAPSDAE